ncbi:hypothetical protein B0T16DRAFT_499710 [Cercophora newfieldiana]|uniref:Uncharacterized protein n=1 Tax=Cercophora newfieldiana TaxID=92897 RepID=A0AA40D0C7_9PEZI|nr:hypothetical protein B0T16DRAFT_499710 [Cercophora newfieldiana]
MCHQEFITYQCGHRSLGVIRPCPLTTAAQNLTPCSTQPSKQYNALTIHQGALSPISAEIITSPFHANKGKAPEGGVPPQVYGQASTSYSTQRQQTPNPTGPAVIPQTYSEMTVNGEHRVSIRVPGLYAAEWLADHRALHASGDCQCRANFEPLKPRIDESSLEASERQLLHNYREFENNGDKMSRREVEERVAEITRLFGLFVAVPVDKTKPNNHQLGASAVPEVIPSQPTQDRYTYIHFSQLATSTPEQLPLVYHDAHPAILESAYPPSAQAHQPTTHGNEAPWDQYYGQGVNSAGAIPAFSDLSHPWYGAPIPVNSPIGNSFWPPHAQYIPGGNPPALVGPGPFTTTGLDFNSVFANDSHLQPGRGQPFPLCGLPVGAGPEGESHMPHWSNPRAPSSQDCRISSDRM